MDQQRLFDAHRERRLTHLGQSHKKATVAHSTEKQLLSVITSTWFEWYGTYISTYMSFGQMFWVGWPTVYRCEFPVAAHCGVTAEREVEPATVLGSVTVPGRQHQGLVLPAWGTQVLPGVISHQNRAVIVHIKDVYGDQRGGWERGVTCSKKNKCWLLE